MTETIGEDRSNGKFARRLGLIGATNIGLGAMLGGGIVSLCCTPHTAQIVAYKHVNRHVPV